MRILPVKLIKSGDLGSFLSVGAHDAHAGEILLGARANLGKEILNFFEARVNLLPEEFYGKRNQRHGHKKQQRELPVDHKQDRQDDDHHEHRLQAVHDHRAGQLAHRGEIIRRAGHQITRAVVLKKRQRLSDQGGVKIVAEIVLNVARHADQNSALEKKKDPAHGAGPEDLQRGNRQSGPRNLGPFRVKRIADD